MNIIINRNKLIQAIMDLEHVAADSRQVRWLVAVPWKDVEQGAESVTARVFWADTPSSRDGYFGNSVGDRNFDVREFLDDWNGGAGPNSYVWGEQGTGSGEEGAWTEEDDEAARHWVEINLAERVTLDKTEFEVVYE